MLRDITIGQHFPGDSLVHRFDPRLKLVLTIAYIVLLFAASNPLGLALSGKQRTPGGGTDLACMLGRETTLARVKAAIEKLNG